MALSKEKSLATEHPEFTRMKNKYDLWEKLCLGGKEIEGKDGYLKRHSYETDKQYKIRLWLSTYRNFAKPIVDVFQSSIWRKKPNRENIHARLKDYALDVDRYGTRADEFFQKVSKKASRVGINFVLVDYTTLPKEKRERVATVRDAKRYDLRPFFKQIPAKNLIDWCVNENPVTGNQYLDYIVYWEDQETEAKPFQGHEYKRRYKVWTRDAWEIWEEEKTGKNSKATMVDSGKNDLGIVPLVPCYFYFDTLMTGRSAIADVSSLCERSYRLGTCLDKSLYDTAFPLQLFTGFTSEEISKFQRSSATGLVSQDHGADSKFVEPEGRSFEALRNAIKDDEGAIKEIALRMVKTDSKVAQSADAKRLDNLQLDSQLGIFAFNVEACEEKCWDLAAGWLGIQQETEDKQVEYHKQFDEQRVTAELIKAFSELARDEIVPKDRVVDMLIEGGFLPEGYDKVEARQQIIDQLRTDTNFPGDGE